MSACVWHTGSAGPSVTHVWPANGTELKPQTRCDCGELRWGLSSPVPAAATGDVTDEFNEILDRCVVHVDERSGRPTFHSEYIIKGRDIDRLRALFAARRATESREAETPWEKLSDTEKAERLASRPKFEDDMRPEGPAPKGARDCSAVEEIEDAQCILDAGHPGSHLAGNGQRFLGTAPARSPAPDQNDGDRCKKCGCPLTIETAGSGRQYGVCPQCQPARSPAEAPSDDEIEDALFRLRYAVGDYARYQASKTFTGDTPPTVESIADAHMAVLALFKRAAASQRSGDDIGEWLLGNFADLYDVLTNVHSLLQGWSQDGSPWSEWDESVRLSVVDAQKKLDKWRFAASVAAARPEQEEAK